MSELDEALLRLGDTGPEFRAGLSNHGPMVVEALVGLGCAEAIGGWVDDYLPRLEDRPARHTPITEATWPEALGDLRRVTDWEDYFIGSLREAPWRDILIAWWPRLVGGMVAGATHGVLRTAHAARALASTPTPERHSEFARALAYWAADYHGLPGDAVTVGRLQLRDAIAALPILEVEPKGLIKHHLLQLDSVPGFETAVRALRPPEDVPAAISELIGFFARVFLTDGRNEPIGYIHAVTMPTAVASLLPELPSELWPSTYAAVWQVTAAIYSGYRFTAGTDEIPPYPAPAPEELAGRAAETGDAHAIKLTEACLRRYAVQPDPIYLQAAGRGIELLGPPRT